MSNLPYYEETKILFDCVSRHAFQKEKHRIGKHGHVTREKGETNYVART